MNTRKLTFALIVFGIATIILSALVYVFEPIELAGDNVEETVLYTLYYKEDNELYNLDLLLEKSGKRAFLEYLQTCKTQHKTSAYTANHNGSSDDFIFSFLIYSKKDGFKLVYVGETQSSSYMIVQDRLFRRVRYIDDFEEVGLGLLTLLQSQITEAIISQGEGQVS